MNLKSLSQQIKIKESFLCVGLDIDLSKIPSHILNEKDPIFFFSKSIIYITHHNKDGAVGIVLNYKIMNIKGSELFKKLHIKDVKSQLGMDFSFPNPVSIFVSRFR